MQSKPFITLAACLAMSLGLGVSQARADIALIERLININGVLIPPDSIPGYASVNDAGFNNTTGLGTISVELSGIGTHFVGLFVDHEIDEAVNTFFNEFGLPVNLPAVQSWEIDEPGFLFGDIYDNFTGSDNTVSLLDNSNGVPASSPDDVSMAHGWNLILAAGETATVTFLLSDSPPGSGFYLGHHDDESDESVYFSSSLRIVGTGVPDSGSSLALLMGSLTVLACLGRGRFATRN